MKSVPILIGLIFCQPALASGDINAISGRIDEAFRSDAMKTLPDSYIPEAGVTVVIEHTISLTEKSDVAQFHKWADVAKWLRSKKTQRKVEGFEDLPIRGEADLSWCTEGLCKYSLEGGMAHNHIYLGELWYKVIDHRPRICGMKIIDGD